MTEGKKLVAKLAEVMASVTHVPKSGVNEAQGYNYARDADVLGAIRKGLAERKIFVTHKITDLKWRQTQGRNGPINVATVYLTCTAHDGETGESMEIASSAGEGMDHGDKQVPKAITGAMKSAMLKAFLIPTGEDPEADSATDRDAATPPPAGGQSRPAPPAPQQQRQTPAQQSSGPLPATFPNFGKRKGAPIHGASVGDLKFYADAARRSLADPNKSRFHDKERANLAAYLAEARRQAVDAQAEPPDDGPPPPGDDDAPF